MGKFEIEIPDVHLINDELEVETEKPGAEVHARIAHDITLLFFLISFHGGFIKASYNRSENPSLINKAEKAMDAVEEFKEELSTYARKEHPGAEFLQLYKYMPGSEKYFWPPEILKNETELLQLAKLMKDNPSLYSGERDS